MRKVLVAVLALLLGVSAGLLVLKRTKLFYYKYLVCYLPPDFSSRPELVMLGDSHISRGEWKGLRKRFHVINLGIGGSTVADLNEKLARVSVKADIVLIHIGINDLRYDGGVSETVARISEVASKVKGYGSPLVVLSAAFPLDESSDLAGGTDNEEVFLMNSLVREVASDEDYLFFSYFDSVESISHFLHDGLHLNEAGYGRLERALDNFLE